MCMKMYDVRDEIHIRKRTLTHIITCEELSLYIKLLAFFEYRSPFAVFIELLIEEKFSLSVTAGY